MTKEFGLFKLVDRMKNEVAAFQEFLQTRSLKSTAQRDLIVKEIFSAPHHHFSAEELLKTARQKDPTISRATVYRTLSLLLESKMLDELDIGKGHKYFEPKFGISHHDHLICLKCEKIIEFENHQIEEIQNKITSAHGFTAVYHTHKIFGTCKNCSKKEKRK